MAIMIYCASPWILGREVRAMDLEGDSRKKYWKIYTKKREGRLRIPCTNTKKLLCFVS